MRKYILAILLIWDTQSFAFVQGLSAFIREKRFIKEHTRNNFQCIKCGFKYRTFPGHCRHCGHKTFEHI